MIAILCLNTNRQTVMTVYGVISMLDTSEEHIIYFPEEPQIPPYFKYKVSLNIDKATEHYILIHGAEVNIGQGWSSFPEYESGQLRYGDALHGNYLSNASAVGYKVPSVYAFNQLALMLNKAKTVMVMGDVTALYLDMRDVSPEIASDLGACLRDLCGGTLIVRTTPAAYIYGVGDVMLQASKIFQRDDYGHFCYAGEFDSFCELVELNRQAYGI